MPPSPFLARGSTFVAGVARDAHSPHPYPRPITKRRRTSVCLHTLPLVVSHGTRPHRTKRTYPPTLFALADSETAIRFVVVLSTIAQAYSVCDGQHADITLHCNSVCQVPAQQTSSGCGALWQEPCYQCCWTPCLSYTIQGGVCGTSHGTKEYESCALGGSCLLGTCPLEPSGDSYGGGGDDTFGNDDLGGGAIAGIVIGVICGVAILSAIVRCLCKKASTPDQVELTSARP